MGTAIAVRTDYSSKELRRLASRVKNAGQARRLLAIAAVLDGAWREAAAKIGGMDRQTLRDWVIRFNEQFRTPVWIDWTLRVVLGNGGALGQSIARATG